MVTREKVLNCGSLLIECSLECCSLDACFILLLAPQEYIFFVLLGLLETVVLILF